MELNSKEILLFPLLAPSSSFQHKRRAIFTCQQAEVEKPFWLGCPLWQIRESASSITAALLCYLLTTVWNMGLLEASSILLCPPTLLQPLVPLQRHNILQTCLHACLFMLVFKNIAKIRSSFSWLGT